MTKLEKIKSLNKMLIQQMPDVAREAATFSDDEKSQRRLLRSMMNVRLPSPLSDEFIKLQDKLLCEEREEKGVAHVADLPAVASDSRIILWQGDYGLWQCSTPCHKATYDNEIQVRQMILAQGFEIAEDGELLLPRTSTSTQIKMQVPASLVLRCPKCGEPMRMNLRADNTFVEDEGWHEASARYIEFLRKNVSVADAHIVFLELGVGYNTPGIIKYPFWQMTIHNKNAT